jgi:hypothetical protein
LPLVEDVARFFDAIGIAQGSDALHKPGNGPACQARHDCKVLFLRSVLPAAGSRQYAGAKKKGHLSPLVG